MKAALVYQAGIANVFRVGYFAEHLDDRGDCVRLLQHALTADCPFRENISRV